MLLVDAEQWPRRWVAQADLDGDAGGDGPAGWADPDGGARREATANVGWDATLRDALGTAGAPRWADGAV